ncbi:MAG: PepSY domain-containing protein [Candidatus Eremiobacteraeota bacterium]|nr:PepSY domain-containing protein [Candidatus Eremiobacteraeota bacterium]
MKKAIKSVGPILAILAISAALSNISQADQSTYRSSIQLPAAERSDREEETALRRLARISMSQALAVARTVVPDGRLLESELDSEDGNIVYEFEFLVQGEERVVVVDAGNGKILASYPDRD